jgi:dephospho-CoA kinase
MFLAHGIPVIDTDAVYHELTSHSSACLDEIRLTFGDGVIDEKGALDRLKLSKIVFSDKEKHKLLGDITYRHILSVVREMAAKLAGEGKRCVIVDAPMLFESGFDKECDYIVCVIADDDIRIDRIVRRDGITPHEARARIASQISNDDLKSRCDYVIYNNSDTTELDKQVSALIKQIEN